MEQLVSPRSVAHLTQLEEGSGSPESRVLSSLGPAPAPRAALQKGWVQQRRKAASKVMKPVNETART